MILYLPRWLWFSTFLLVALYWLNPSWKSDALYTIQAVMTLASAVLFAKRRYWLLAAGLTATLFADLNYYIQVYKLKLDTNSLRSYLTTSLTYSVAFALISLSLYRQVRRGTNLFRSFKLSLVPILFLLAASISMSLPPLLKAFQQGNIQYHELGALTLVSISLPLIVVSYLAIMLSFELTESCLAMGALLIGLVDWAIEMEYMTSGRLAFSYLDFFWFFGLLLIFSRSLDPSELREYVYFKGKSLRVQLKILTLLCSLLPVGVYYLSNHGDLQTGMGFFLFGTAFSLFVASIVVEYFSQQLRGLTKEIQQIFDSSSSDPKINPAPELSEEWGESLKIILRNKLWQDKLKVDQERWLLEKRNEISAQVSHDIRSPLTVLNLAISDVGGLPEQQRNLVKNAVARINDIANTLNRTPSHSLATAGELQSLLLSPLIDSLVTEKRVQFREMRDVVIEADFSQAYGYFISADPVELKRALSNLITNSVEAFVGGVGRVVVTVEGDERSVRLRIADNGKGIPKGILNKIGNLGFSFGKAGSKSGSGLGVHHARATVESVGGAFVIESVEGQGTAVTLTFKRAPTPAWFVERLALKQGGVVCSIDDDISIHQLWSERLASVLGDKSGLEHLMFTSIRDFRAWFKERGEGESSAKGLFLFDYEFSGQARSGLDLIEELGLGRQSVLVTSRYEERSVRERCDKLGVPLIPKAMAGFVPIVIG